MYVRSNPLTGIDLRGLTTYRGFDPQRENEMRLAVEDAKDKIRNCPGCRPTCQNPNPNSDDCFPDDDLKRKLIDKLDKATFVYDSSTGLCGYVGFFGWFINRVNIGDLELSRFRGRLSAWVTSGYPQAARGALHSQPGARACG